MTDIEIKTGMTDAECERLDKYYTENTFTPGPNLLKLGIKPGEVRNTLLLKNLDRDVEEFNHEPHEKHEQKRGIG